MADFDPQEFEQFKSSFNPDEFSQFKQSAPTEAPDNSVDLTDVAKSGATGVGRGIMGLAGLPGDIQSAASNAGQWIGDKLGLKPLPDEQKRKLARTLGPTSSDIQSRVEFERGPLYQPKTTIGKYAQTAGEFLPAIVGGPGGLVRRGVTQVLAPAIASEAAGQAAEGSDAEPYLRVAGALAGGAGASRLANAGLARPAVPSVGQLEDAARAGYRHPEVTRIEISPHSVNAAADDIVSRLNADGFRRLNAPQTYGVVDELRTPVGQTARVADIDSVRRALNRTAGNFSNPTEQAAANRAIHQIDDYLTNITQPDLIRGNAATAQRILADARSNWSAARHGQTMADKLTEADRQAAATYSGGNLDNATRQKLKSILNSRRLSRGYTQDQLDQMDRIVRGTFTGNTARAIGKLLGGGGGLGTIVTAGEGAMAAGPAGLALPLVGMAGRALGTRSTTRAAARLEEAVRSNSPEGRQWAAILNRINARQPNALSDRALALLRANYASTPARSDPSSPQ